LTHLRVDTFIASGNWTCPAGVESAVVECWGAGGSGTAGVGGGGGGGYSKATLTVVPSTVYAVTLDSTASSFADPATVSAASGKDGGDGGSGGSSLDGIGDVKFGGGDGSLGTGNQAGGSGAGDIESGVGTTPGRHQGGQGSPDRGGNILSCGGRSTDALSAAGSRGEARISYLVSPPDGFVSVRARSWTRIQANATSHPIGMPSGIEAGDLLLAFFSVDGLPTLSGYDAGGWSLLGERVGGGGSNQQTSALLYKEAAGSDTLSVTTSAAEMSSTIVFRISGHSGSPLFAAADGNSTNFDSPELNAGSAGKYLWLSLVGWDQSGSFPTLSPPADYGSFISVPAGNTQGVGAASVERFLEAAVENPGAWNSTTEQWSAFTVAVASAASGLVAHATSKAASSASDTVQIASHDSGTDANRVLTVSVRVRKASGTCEVTGVTCGASALTKKVGALDDFDGIVRAESWYLYLPPEGASAVTASFSSAADGAEIVATTWNGCAGLGPNTDTAVGSLTNVSMGLTSQAATSKLVGAWAGLDARVVTPGAGVTEIDSL
jgi:hypothetical protein